MTTTTTSQNDKPTDSGDHTEEVAWSYQGDTSGQAAAAMTPARMARRLPQLIARSFAPAWRLDRGSVLALLACQIVSGVLGAFGLFATTGTITALVGSGDVSGRMWDAAPSVLLIAASAGLRALLGIVITWLSHRLSPKISRESELRLAAATMNAELSAYDTSGFQDRWDAADRGAEVSQEILGQAQNVIAAAASLVAAASVAGILHPLLLPLLLLAALPQGIASIKVARLQYLAMLDTFADRRVLGLMRWFMADKACADAIRADTMAPVLLDRYARAGAKVDRRTNEAAWTSLRVSLAWALVAGAGGALVWGALVWLLATGRMSVVSAGTAVFALVAAGNALRGVVGEGTTLFRTGMYLDDWSTFLDEAGGHRLDRGRTAPAAPDRIEVRGVGYRYPETDATALEDVDFTIRRGEIVAVVGVNGSGKSTLMRLLTALYLPTVGTVRWDGTDTRDLDPHAAWRHVAVTTQEFARWPMNAADNVHLGQPVDDPAALDRAAAATGADEVVAELRSGWRTLLSKKWWGGVELSSGQWQRLAVARSFYRPAALMILDEPTSDLDPRAEHRILRNLRALARSRAIVLVTHNLINTAVADRIVVLHKGRIIQEGTFPQLTTTEGAFREMWLMQHDRGDHADPANPGDHGIPVQTTGRARTERVDTKHTGAEGADSRGESTRADSPG
ncbi:ATP-binding cassette domain-containing protein [Kitasatospora sp. NPDC052868]|uniref:ATP-binding cassette domain-containing protein n=1 Tax=Kitasatospora sp. NPDC052868 TaxID=3364060 RepID=UPI0037CC6CF1